MREYCATNTYNLSHKVYLSNEILYSSRKCLKFQLRRFFFRGNFKKLARRFFALRDKAFCRARFYILTPSLILPLTSLFFLFPCAISSLSFFCISIYLFVLSHWPSRLRLQEVICSSVFIFNCLYLQIGG